MELKHLNKDEFEQAVNAGDELVVVDFFATWCGPCKMLGPVIERAADKFSDVHFYKVDIDEEMDLAAMQSGEAPRMPLAYVSHDPEGMTLDAGQLSIVWFEEGDAAALLEGGQIIAVIPGWAGAQFPGYSRYA